MKTVVCSDHAKIRNMSDIVHSLWSQKKVLSTY